MPFNSNYVTEKVDAAEIFKNFLNRSEIFNMNLIKDYLSLVKNDLCLVIDNMHGSSRGYIERILGENLLIELQQANAIKFVNTEEDFSFHGVKPEPSAKNMKSIIQMTKDSGRKLTLAVALDPDADRIRFGTADADIEMNKFGAIAYASLLDSGIKGPIASSLPTSDFALAIAKAEGQVVYETKVGFKWFRPYRDAIVCFEESDGISVKGHTLEKDAIAGLLLALDVMRTKGKTISEYFTSLQQRYGYYYPDKAGVDVVGVSVEQWQEYKNNVVNTLQESMFKVGQMIEINKAQKTIIRINIEDGLKLIFNDNSWILLRPSGTEPKFRIYFEVTSSTQLSDPQPVLKGYLAKGIEILEQSRAIVDGK
jgi:phosphomannomutase